MKVEDVVVGEEYEYLDQWVKVTAIDGTVAFIETRFGSCASVPVFELLPKRKRDE
jgi:hypothetical protein